MQKTYNYVKPDFLSLQSREWLSRQALTCLGKLRACLQVSSEFLNDVLHYRYLSFGQIDPFYHKHLINSTKNDFQIACVQFIELIFTYNLSSNFAHFSQKSRLLWQIVGKIFMKFSSKDSYMVKRFTLFTTIRQIFIMS